MILGLPIAFTTPWLLAGLVALPVLWWLLRAIPPAPLRQRFPAVTLLLDLEDRDAESDRTPWWLLLLRLLAVAALILGFAGPVLNPEQRQTGRGPLLIFVDAQWTAASDWPQRMGAIEDQLDAAAQAGRTVAIALSHEVTEAGADAPQWQSAGDWRARLSGLSPVAWDAPYGAASAWVAALQDADTIWISDGVARTGRLDLLAEFEAKGRVDVLQPTTPRFGLLPARAEDGALVLEALRSGETTGADLVVQGIGPDPSGVERVLASSVLSFAAGAARAEVQMPLPPELRNRITRFQLEDQRAAGAVTLADDSLRRRRVALLTGTQSREGLELLSPLHYLREALVPSAEVIEDAAIDTLIEAGPEVLILPDVPSLVEPDQRALAEWVAQGGLLLRFAGPRLAAADTGRGVEDILLPVRLRSGGRVVGGAMSWGAPRALAPFPETSPFFGLRVPDDVLVRAQILAEPSPNLADRTLASLADGTPLVTRKALGQGQVVLFHVSANAEWSSLALSGLFVQMLERLAISTRPGQVEAQTLEGTQWVAERVLDPFGQLGPAGAQAGVDGPRLLDGARAEVPPGLYADGDRRLAVNTLGPDAQMTPANWPARIAPRWEDRSAARSFAPYLLAAALILGMLDILASLWISGRLRRRAVATGLRVSALVVTALLALPNQGVSQDADTHEAVIGAASTVTLAHVLSGDPATDEIAKAGLMGLSDQLFSRTSVEPAPPVGLDIERDELSVYPFLYWPIGDTTRQPSPAAYARLKTYLAAGGFILFDTRDAGFGGESAAARRLRTIALPLGLPPLEQVPHDHVLTRAFYLLEEFPGRARGPAWVEAAPPNAERAEGMPFRNLNDGVSPVIIGGNDWAGAWAIRADGAPMFPVGRGQAGERQREMAVRFGVNLVMHVLTGNYKSDQVHVPALLERLGE
ncbi:N-terminal double-transmembrane domain-containing protein [Aliiroseovarius sediminilitoris]|uniref:N-terminal double-transmembrane domain-containing protein n=1 Tax=Aliiroseovarius sediminilitoris TaxID=1173584 RepID=A0A1I0NP27_9RHOB|nr:DUF4159 domain-containing protein [Aliiroseovarius sediminilitoris]SEW03215.1 N-terminal double-transmembrane domain-containing protein [Aliiroseovarius sediminilitoris]